MAATIARLLTDSAVSITPGEYPYPNRHGWQAPLIEQGWELYRAGDTYDDIMERLSEANPQTFIDYLLAGGEHAPNRSD